MACMDFQWGALMYNPNGELRKEEGRVSVCGFSFEPIQKAAIAFVSARAHKSTFEFVGQIIDPMPKHAGSCG